MSGAPLRSALIDRARAKVNLTLRIISRRTDGYHELESVVAFADCADRLTLQPGAALGLVTAGPGAGQCGEPSDNLIIKAARLLGERVDGLQLGAFTLDKQLPVAAGIGGGSADAAAALRLLALANEIESSDPRLMEAAQLAGADVPVCLKSESCIMTGVGATLLSVRLPPLPAVLVNPGVPLATKDVFAALGLRPGELRVGFSDVLRSVAWPEGDAASEAWIAALVAGSNDLEAAALKIEPAIGDVLTALKATTHPRLVRMSGSGATCFAIFDSDADAQSSADALRRDHPAWWVHAGILG